MSPNQGFAQPAKSESVRALMQLARTQVQEGKAPAALDSLRKARALAPNSEEVLSAFAQVLNARNQYADAQTVLSRALDLEPDNLEAAAALAEAEEAQGNLTAADARARRVLDRSPGHPGALLVSGMVRLKQDRYADARDALERSIAANPGSPKAHYQLSLAYARLGDDVNAKKHQDLYKARLRETEERLRDLRAQSGAPPPVR